MKYATLCPPRPPLTEAKAVAEATTAAHMVAFLSARKQVWYLSARHAIEGLIHDRLAECGLQFTRAEMTSEGIAVLDGRSRQFLFRIATPLWAVALDLELPQGRRGGLALLRVMLSLGSKAA